ncbi:MAG TPA: hypothetical protein ENJ82_04415, partial [Bacteroidetes bacterium]|nr:hypothetical protein [Bacteroidota bacterium]
MKRLQYLFLLFFGLLIGMQTLAQSPVFSGKDPLTDEAEFSMTLSKSGDFCIGDVIKVCFKGKINTDGWHLYSSRTDGEISYNPTMLDVFLDESNGVKLKGKMTENKQPREIEDELMGGLIRDFKEHEVTFCQNLEITAANVNVVAEFSAQTCTDAGMCKFLKLPFEWKFKAKVCGDATPEKGGNNDPVKGSNEENDPEKTENDAAYVAPQYNFSAFDAEKLVSENVCSQNRLYTKGLSADAPDNLCFFYDYAQGLQYAKSVNKPLLAFFTAQNSANSRKMEAELWNDVTVTNAMQNGYVIAALYADSKTKLDPVRYNAAGKKFSRLGEWVKDLQSSKFKSSTQPFYAVVDHNGNTLGAPIGFTSDKEMFSTFLSGGITAFNQSHGIAATPGPETPDVVAMPDAGNRQKG